MVKIERFSDPYETLRGTQTTAYPAGDGLPQEGYEEIGLGGAEGVIPRTEAEQAAQEGTQG